MTALTPPEMIDIINQLGGSAPVGWLEIDVVPAFGKVHVGGLAMAVNRGRTAATLESITIRDACEALRRSNRNFHQLVTSWLLSSTLSHFDLSRPVLLMRGPDKKLVLIDGARRVLGALQAGKASITAYVVHPNALEEFRVDITSSEYQPELSSMKPGDARREREKFFSEVLSQNGSPTAKSLAGETTFSADDRVYLAPHIADDKINPAGSRSRRGAPPNSLIAQTVYRHLIQHVDAFIGAFRATSACKNDAGALEVLSKVANLPARDHLLTALAAYRKTRDTDHGWRPKDQMLFLNEQPRRMHDQVSLDEAVVEYTSNKVRVL